MIDIVAVYIVLAENTVSFGAHATVAVYSELIIWVTGIALITGTLNPDITDASIGAFEGNVLQTPLII